MGKVFLCLALWSLMAVGLVYGTGLWIDSLSIYENESAAALEIIFQGE